MSLAVPRDGRVRVCRAVRAGPRLPGLQPLSPQDVEAAMRLPLAFAVLLLASSQALGEEMGATDDLSYWSDWSDSDQGKVSPGGWGSEGLGAGCSVRALARAGLNGGSALSAARCRPAGGAAAAPGALPAEDGPETPAPAVLRPHGQAGRR